VRPRLLGRPGAGHEVAEVTSVPPELRISGPRSRVQEVESAFTEPVSLEGATRDLTESVSVGLEDPMLRLLDASRVKVTAAWARSGTVFEASPWVRDAQPGPRGVRVRFRAGVTWNASGPHLVPTSLGPRGALRRSPWTFRAARPLGGGASLRRSPCALGEAEHESRKPTRTLFGTDGSAAWPTSRP
jgi:hypothetical protein